MLKIPNSAQLATKSAPVSKQSVPALSVLSPSVRQPTAARSHGRKLWQTVPLALLGGLICLPLLSIFVLALGVTPESIAHLAAYVLPRALWATVALMLGVGLLTVIVGTGLAWLTTMYRFRGAALVDVLIVLPMAMPAYIIAYAYGDWLDVAGPVQSGIRALGGFATPRDYWFPNIRSAGGAVFLLASVLYPYVYLAARASFIQQSICVLEVARTLGRTPFGVFRGVALPLARPAIAAGAALVLMETLNDLGAVQYLGVETLSVALVTTWLQRSDLAGAAFLALVALGLVAVVLGIERQARSGRGFHHTTGRYRAIPFETITGPRAFAMAGVCLVPPILGFFVPLGILAGQALNHGVGGLSPQFGYALFNSLWLATATAIATLVLGLGLVMVLRRARSAAWVRVVPRLAGVGYAVPGTVLALGLLLPLAKIDNAFAETIRGLFGVSPGLLLTGSSVIVVIALMIRFLTVALTTTEAGFERLSPNLEPAARALGASPMMTLIRVNLPLLVPTLGAAALLVFVDAMKELPATLLLRPLGFETLSTLIYAHAALEEPEKAAAGALAIVCVGLVPVMLLQRAMRWGRAGQG